MKKVLAVILLLAMCVSLAACGEKVNAAVAAAEGLITDIGEVTLEKEEAVAAAEAAYSALSEEDKAQVTNYPDLVAVRETLDALLLAKAEEEAAAAYEAAKAVIVGKWVELFGFYEEVELPYDEPLEITVNGEPKIIETYTDYQYRAQGPSVLAFQPDDTCALDEESFSWRLDEDSVFLDEEIELKVIREYRVPLLYNEKTAKVFVHEDDYEGLYQELFVTVEVDPDNIRDYVGEPELIGYMLRDGAEDRDGTYWIMPNLVYDQGLTYFACEDFGISVHLFGNLFFWDIDEDVTMNSPYNLMELYNQGYEVYQEYEFRDQVQAEGRIIYLRSEYVAENKLDENGYRILVLKGGITWKPEYDFFYSDTWAEKSADYADHLY